MAQVKIMTDDGSAFRVAVQLRGPDGEWVHCEPRLEVGASPELPLGPYRYVIDPPNGAPLNVSRE